MKILFLDLDDVLNDKHTRQRIDHPSVPGLRCPGVSPRKAERLSDVLRRTAARVVISSNWRLEMPFRDIVLYLRKQGLKGQIIDHTPIDPDTGEKDRRGEEIALWLAAHPEVDCYAIVDDLPEKQFLSEQLPRLVRTQPGHGLWQMHAEALVKLLGVAPQCEWCDGAAEWMFSATCSRGPYARLACERQEHVVKTRQLLALDLGDVPYEMKNLWVPTPRT